MAVGFAEILMIAVLSVTGQSGAKNGEWRSYGADLGNTHYSPADQINASNFGSLEIAWRFSTVNLGPSPEYRFQSTPVMVDGVLYTTGGSRRGSGASGPSGGRYACFTGRSAAARAARTRSSAWAIGLSLLVIASIAASVG